MPPEPQPQRPEIRFYHLERQQDRDALPALLEKALETYPRILVKSSDPSRLKPLSERLWSANPHSFLAHGIAGNGDEDRQPILLTDQDNNPNAAQMLVLLDQAPAPDIDVYFLCCLMFDGNHSAALDHARAQWKEFKERGYAMTYWQQSAQGWQKKAQENQLEQGVERKV